MVLLFLGIVYIMSLRASHGYVSFILIGVAAAIMIYWVRVLKKMTKDTQPQYTTKENDAKNWVYDLIKGEQEIVFVAEVPGPEDMVSVRLIDGILYIRGSGRFSKEVPIEVTPDMGIHKKAINSLPIPVFLGGTYQLCLLNHILKRPQALLFFLVLRKLRAAFSSCLLGNEDPFVVRIFS